VDFILSYLITTSNNYLIFKLPGAVIIPGENKRITNKQKENLGENVDTLIHS
jgi:hypothetical protein